MAETKRLEDPMCCVVLCPKHGARDPMMTAWVQGMGVLMICVVCKDYMPIDKALAGLERAVTEAGFEYASKTHQQ